METRSEFSATSEDESSMEITILEGGQSEEETQNSEADNANKKENFSETTDEPTAEYKILEVVNSMKNEFEGFKGTFSEMSKKVANMDRLYHNEFSGRLLSMQKDLEEYHERDKGRIYDEILTEFAKLYSDNIDITTAATDETLKKRLDYLFQDILYLLEKYGVMKLSSSQGDPRDIRHCKVIEREQTNDISKHDTVVRSRSVGFYADNRTLVKENIDVYVYKEDLTEAPPEK